MNTLVGVLGSPARAEVDARGRVRPLGSRGAFDWWIGADDRWRRFAVEAAVRQSRPGPAPVLETALRVPGGDAVQRVWGVGTAGGQIVVEFENRSPAPFVVAAVVDTTDGPGPRRIELDGHVVRIDREPALVVPGPVRRWAAGPQSAGDLFATVEANGARSDAFVPIAVRRGEAVRAALLFAVPHRSRLRFAVPFHDADVVPAALPDAEESARGWSAQLDRGMRVAVPDEGLQRAVDAARAEILLRDARDPYVVRALEDWGFDAEAAAGFLRLSLRDRRTAARRDPAPDDPWRAAFAAALDDPLGLLAAVRAAVVHDGDDGGVTLLPTWPDEWRGQSLEVHDAPTRSGPVSYAIRWHGEHAALIWDVTVPRALRAPGLAPTWHTDAAVGEALLV